MIFASAATRALLRGGLADAVPRFLSGGLTGHNSGGATESQMPCFQQTRTFTPPRYRAVSRPLP